jgi:GMP synthase-like glutamine amidotransferase
MAILIINNYPSEKDLFKIDKIKNALLKLRKDKVITWSFSEINDQSPPVGIEAIVLSGSDSHLDRPDDLEMYNSEIELIKKANIPILGICFGHQLIGVAFGSKLHPLPDYIRGFKNVKILQPDEIFSLWKEGEVIYLEQYHKDSLFELPQGFVCLAESESCKIEAMKHQTRPIYGIQAHIERATDENPHGLQILKNFLDNVVEKYTIPRIVETKSLSELKQAMIDSLRGIEYDIAKEDRLEIDSKLKNAQKYLEAWTLKKFAKGLF